MHILYHHRTPGDGVERVHIAGMVKAWRRMGHTVAISGPPGCDPERELRPAPGGHGTGKSGAGLHYRLGRFARQAPPVLFEAAELGYNAYALADMTRLSGRRRPDLIYERFTSNSLAPTLFARSLGIPIVQEVNLLVGAGRLRPLALGYLSGKIERWVLGQSTLVVTVSGRFREMLEALGVSRQKVLVCPNAIDPDSFLGKGLSDGEGRANGLVVGYVGSFIPYHRLDLLVRAAVRLNASDPSLRFLLVGDGAERPRIEQLIARSGLSERFVLTGRVPHDEIAGVVAGMDIAVMPGSNDWGSPVKIFEYMAMGKPVIAPRVGPIEEVITHGRNGLLFGPGSLEELAGMVEVLARDDRLRTALGEQARADVLERHTWRRNAERVLEALSQRVSSKSLSRTACFPGQQSGRRRLRAVVRLSDDGTMDCRCVTGSRCAG